RVTVGVGAPVCAAIAGWGSPASTSRATCQRCVSASSSDSVQRSRKNAAASSSVLRERIASKSSLVSAVCHSCRGSPAATVLPYYHANMALQVIPAVDVLGESAARLEQGAYDRAVAEAGDPAALVRRYASAGAALVHVVDLDGARSGRLRAGLVGELVAAARPAAVQASGGVRSVGDALALVAAGAERVVVGTAA